MTPTAPSRLRLSRPPDVCLLGHFLLFCVWLPGGRLGPRSRRPIAAPGPWLVQLDCGSVLKWRRPKSFKGLNQSDGPRGCCPHLVSQPLSFLILPVLFGRFHRLLCGLSQVVTPPPVHVTLSFLFDLVLLPSAQVFRILPLSPPLPLFVLTLEALLLFLPTLLLPISVRIRVTLPELLPPVFFGSASEYKSRQLERIQVSSSRRTERCRETDTITAGGATNLRPRSSFWSMLGRRLRSPLPAALSSLVSLSGFLAFSFGFSLSFSSLVSGFFKSCLIKDEQNGSHTERRATGNCCV